MVRIFFPMVGLMLATLTTFTIDGLEPRRIAVEVDVTRGLANFQIVGLADAAVREARERVRSALLNSGFEFPQRRITANLAPASIRKIGPGFDLALALGLLIASGQIKSELVDRVAVFGELSLSGRLRPCRGVLAAAEGADASGLRGLAVTTEQASEAALIESLVVYPVDTLRAAADVFTGSRAVVTLAPREDPPTPLADGVLDLADLRGHSAPINALKIAAAGGHNLLFQGPPGTGKTMLARRLPSILPPLTRSEAIEVTRIQSVVGIGSGTLVEERPFRSPHHTISTAGLVGGGTEPRPGEVSFAHHGVLFLDELSEFARSSLEALRQPLEDGVVTIVRIHGAAAFPSRFMLAAATNPCPCGFAGSGGDRCRCSETELLRYRRRLSGPLLDRIDLVSDVQRPSGRELRSSAKVNSDAVRAEVCEARERQIHRFADQPGAVSNAQLDGRLVERYVQISSAAERSLTKAYDDGSLSARGRHRVLRLARTIADLDRCDRVKLDHLLCALALRQQEPTKAVTV